MSQRVAVLCGGVGAARFLRGLAAAVDPASITAIVNTGDDLELHGLSISPDLDTVTYTLAGAVDPGRGWGLEAETWRSMEALARYDVVRPAGSSAGVRWFNLGDLDLATHLYRTARLREGARPTVVADEVRRAWGVPLRVVPMSDDRLQTIVSTTEHGDLPFQDYFVRLRHDVPVTGVRFAGAARPSPETIRALREADVIVVAPSNPVVSIGPIRALAGIDELLAERRRRVVAISPIVGGVALKGPAARMLDELGHEASAAGVARLYAPIASALVVDPVDEPQRWAVEAAGVRCVVTPSVMSTPEVARRLAVHTVAAVG